MKKMYIPKIFFVLVFIISDYSLFSQSYSKQFVPYRVADGWTVSDLEGNKLTSQVFDSIFHFPNTKYILIQKKEKWGLLDSAMKITIPCEYDYPPWYCGYGVLVVKDKKMGVLDENGKIMIPIVNDYISQLGNYYDYTIGKVIEDSLMTLAGIIDAKKKKYKIKVTDYSTREYLSRNLNQSINHFYPYFHYHIPEIETMNHLFLVGNWRDSIYLSALYDSDGKLLIEEENLFVNKNFESIISYNGSEFKIFSINGKNLSLKGTVKNRLVEIDTKDFYKKYTYKNYKVTEGFYFLKDDNQKVHIVSFAEDKMNDILFNKDMPREIKKINKHFYQVWVKNHVHEIFNSYGKKLYEIMGGIRLPGYFNPGLDEESEFLLVNANNQMALLNSSGLDEKLGWKKEIIISRFHPEIWQIKENDSSYYFYTPNSKLRKDKKWKWIFDLKMKSLYCSLEHLYYKNDKGKWGVFDLNGNNIIPNLYDNMEEFFDHGFLVAELNGKTGLLDSAGKIMIPFEWKAIGSSPYIIKKGDQQEKIYFNVFDSENENFIDLKTGKMVLEKNYDIFYLQKNITGLKKHDFGPDTVFIYDLNTNKIIGSTIMKVEQKTLKNEYNWYFAYEDDFYDGFMTVFNNNEWNIIDSSGNYLFEKGFDFPIYYFPEENSLKTNVGDYSEQRAFFINGKLSAFFDSQIININSDFTNFSAIMRKHYDSNENEKGYYHVDKNLQSKKLDSILRIRGYNEINRNYIIFETNNGRGLMDKFGNILLPPVYSYIDVVFDFYILDMDSCVKIYNPNTQKMHSENKYVDIGYSGGNYVCTEFTNGFEVFRNDSGKRSFWNNRYNDRSDLYHKSGKLLLENVIVLDEVSDEILLIRENGKLFYFNINSGIRFLD